MARTQAVRGSLHHCSSSRGDFHGVGEELHIGHRLPQLDKRAGHVIGRCHDNERAVALAAHPDGRFDGVVFRVERPLVEVDTAVEEIGVAVGSVRADDFQNARAFVDAGNKQAARPSLGKEPQRLRNPVLIARQRHDPVSLLRNRRGHYADRVGENEEPDAKAMKKIAVTRAACRMIAVALNAFRGRFLSEAVLIPHRIISLRFRNCISFFLQRRAIRRVHQAFC